MAAMDFLTSPMLANIPGLVHGFGQRLAGTRAMAREAAQETFRMAGDVFFLRQVHGGAVVPAPWTEPPDADASLTEHAGELLAIETADCLPVLIVDASNLRVAAAHAGWRGTVAQVARHAVEALVARGSKPGELLVALGPSIGPCCYEVGADVEEAFGPGGSRFLERRPSGRSHLDVAEANRTQLEQAGVLPSHIDKVNLCTRCREDLFFSYRRDGAYAGRMISVVGFSRTLSASVSSATPPSSSPSA
jgi:YfiH family protein